MIRIRNKVLLTLQKFHSTFFISVFFFPNIKSLDFRIRFFEVPIIIPLRNCFDESLSRIG